MSPGSTRCLRSEVSASAGPGSVAPSSPLSPFVEAHPSVTAAASMSAYRMARDAITGPLRVSWRAMLTLVPDAIEAYAQAHTSASPRVHAELREYTNAHTDLPQMLVGDMEGRLLYLLTKLTNARLAVEIGTFTGCSALHISEGLAEGGRLITCDVSEEYTNIARAFWDRVPWGDRIDLRLAPAIETLATIEGPIDFVFIDADKTGYIGYWEALVPKLRRGGVIVADNVLWSGRVLAPEQDSDRAIVAFNEHVQRDDRMEHVMLTVRDGMTVARKR